MRWVLVSAVAIALLGSVSGSAAAKPQSVDATLTANVTRIWDANSCCTIERDLEGTATVAPFRRLRFVGEYDLVSHFFPTYGSTNALALTFSAAPGDRLKIGGSSDFFDFGGAPPAAPWSIVAATGRFSGWRGSGTYTITGLDPANPFDPTTPFTVSLVGTVTR